VWNALETGKSQLCWPTRPNGAQRGRAAATFDPGRKKMQRRKRAAAVMIAFANGRHIV
jgi:hypothetical protein